MQPQTPCRNLGEPARVQECPTCNGKVLLRVFACAVHNECTPAKRLEGVACCEGCPDYQETA